MRRFLTILALWLITCWSVIGTLLAPVVPGGWLTVLALALLTTAPLAAIVRGRQGSRTPGAASRLLLLRPFVYAQLLLPLLAIGGLVGAIGGLPFHHTGLVGRDALAAVAVFFALMALLGLLGSRRLVTTEIVAVWNDLPAALDGLRIVQISDTHVGPQTSRAHLRRVMRLVEAARPDIIVVTGDLVDDHVSDVDAYERGLGRLAAPLGVWAIAGNHDVYAGWPALRARLAQLPMTVLVNEWRWIEHRGARFVLLGAGDPAGSHPVPGRPRAAVAPDPSERGAPDLPRAFAGVPDDAFVIALAHNPALWPPLAERGVRLTLSGHTHWGQFAIPGLGWSLASPFNVHAMGGYVNGDSLLYVHPGTNFWGIPFRLGTPPEVAVIVLRRGPTA